MKDPALHITLALAAAPFLAGMLYYEWHWIKAVLLGLFAFVIVMTVIGVIIRNPAILLGVLLGVWLGRS